jgi:hypothetical protein
MCLHHFARAPTADGARALRHDFMQGVSVCSCRFQHSSALLMEAEGACMVPRAVNSKRIDPALVLLT